MIYNSNSLNYLRIETTRYFVLIFLCVQKTFNCVQIDLHLEFFFFKSSHLGCRNTLAYAYSSGRQTRTCSVPQQASPIPRRKQCVYYVLANWQGERNFIGIAVNIPRALDCFTVAHVSSFTWKRYLPHLYVENEQHHLIS